MKHKGKMAEWGGYSAYWDYEIDPNDFLDCKDEEDLIDEVTDYLLDQAELKLPKNMDCECDEYHTNIPNSFIEEWRHLKSIKDGTEV